MKDLTPKQQAVLEQVWDAHAHSLLLNRPLARDEVYEIKSKYREIVIPDFAPSANISFSVKEQVIHLHAIDFLNGPIQHPFSLIRLLDLELSVYTYGRLLIKNKEYVFMGVPGRVRCKAHLDEIELADLIKASTKVLISPLNL